MQAKMTEKNLCKEEGKKNRVSPAKKNPTQAMDKKNSCKLKIPAPLHHFYNGRSLTWLAIAPATRLKMELREKLYRTKHCLV